MQITKDDLDTLEVMVALDKDVRDCLILLASEAGISLEEAIRQIAKEICDDLDNH